MRPPHSTTVNRQKLRRLENHRAETITHCSSAKTNMQYGFGMVISGSPADPGRQNQRHLCSLFRKPFQPANIRAIRYAGPIDR